MYNITTCDCAYYVDNWIYGYQVYCTHPTEYWINPIGLIIIFILIILFIITKYIDYNKNKK